MKALQLLTIVMILLSWVSDAAVELIEIDANQAYLHNQPTDEFVAVLVEKGKCTQPFMQVSQDNPFDTITYEVKKRRDIRYFQSVLTRDESVIKGYEASIEPPL